MNPDQVRKQLDNMEAFILKEAREKQREIQDRAEEEFTIEKARLVQAEKQKIKKEYERKFKNIELKKKIKYSNKLNKARLEKLKAREDIVSTVKEEAQARLVELGKPGRDYEELLQALILQALLKLEEPEVAIRCRKEDEEAVKTVAPKAVQQFTQKSGKKCSFTIDKVNYLPPAPVQGSNAPSCCGGIVLSANGDRIVCDNTLNQRLLLAFDALIPELRGQLFRD